MSTTIKDLVDLEQELLDFEATQEHEPEGWEEMVWREMDARRHNLLLGATLYGLGYRRDVGLRATRVG